MMPVSTKGVYCVDDPLPHTDFFSESDQVAQILQRLLRYAGAKQGGNAWPHVAVKVLTKCIV